MQLDHLAICAETLDAGTGFVEEAFGTELAPGGVHPAMGTHNRLLSLGPETYLEVIAIDPAATPPKRPRWFDLDRFSGPPRLANWIVRCDDLAAALTRLPIRGEVIDLQRGDLTWRMAVPDDGVTPFGGLAPAMIAWQGEGHPARRLPDRACRLRRLTVSLPRAADLRAALPGLDDRIEILRGAPELRAEFDTPRGRLTL